jgi:hypothetical protein
VNQILKQLIGGDLRSIGKANEVIQQILDNSQLFPDVFEGLTSDEPIIRMRSANVIEKVAKQHPEYLQPFKSQSINEISRIDPNKYSGMLPKCFLILFNHRSERAKYHNEHLVDLSLSTHKCNCENSFHADTCDFRGKRSGYSTKNHRIN